MKKCTDVQAAQVSNEALGALVKRHNTGTEQTQGQATVDEDPTGSREHRWD